MTLIGGLALDWWRNEGEAAELSGVIDLDGAAVFVLFSQFVTGEEVGVGAVALTPSKLEGRLLVPAEIRSRHPPTFHRSLRNQFAFALEFESLRAPTRRHLRFR